MANEDINGAINYLKLYRKSNEILHNMSPKDSVAYYATDKSLKYLDMAIKALEQEPKTDVLDKIRAEIEDIAFDWQEIDGEHENFMVVDLNDALQIIDKYKAESEE